LALNVPGAWVRADPTSVVPRQAQNKAIPTNNGIDVVRWLMALTVHWPRDLLNQNPPPPEPLGRLASKPVLTITLLLCYIADIKTTCLRGDDFSPV
jgi:hypothetical protein